MKKIFVSLSFIFAFFTSVCVAGAPNMGDFPFERSVILPQIDGSGMVKIDLDLDLLKNINEKFSNFDLYNDRNEEIPFGVFLREPHLLDMPKILEVSSQYYGSNPMNLIDNNVLTEYIFDEEADGREASWVLLDLGRKMSVTRIKTFIPQDSSIQSMEIWGGSNEEDRTDLKKIIKQKRFEQQLDTSTPAVRYLKVMYWGGNAEKNIKVSDIKIYTNNYGIVTFNAVQGERYKILYGGSKVDLIRYEKRFGDEPTGIEKIAFFSREKDNPFFPVDFDGDGIENKLDNCPYVANPNQDDTDEDRIGNECDNALSNKNFTQTDTDRDGVGDVADNCRLTKNSDQANKDNDEYGDACDSAYGDMDSPDGGAIDNMVSSKMGHYIAVGGIALIILIVFFAGVLRKKK